MNPRIAIIGAGTLALRTIQLRSHIQPVEILMINDTKEGHYETKMLLCNYEPIKKEVPEFHADFKKRRWRDTLPWNDRRIR